MARYYSINGTGHHDMVVALRGDDDNRQVEVPMREPDLDATNFVPEPAKYKNLLALHYGGLARADLTLIFRISDDGQVECWVEEGKV